jgi:hypothetical protein
MAVFWVVPLSVLVQPYVINYSLMSWNNPRTNSQRFAVLSDCLSNHASYAWYHMCTLPNHWNLYKIVQVVCTVLPLCQIACLLLKCLVGSSIDSSRTVEPAIRVKDESVSSTFTTSVAPAPYRVRIVTCMESNSLPIFLLRIGNDVHWFTK